MFRIPVSRFFTSTKPLLAYDVLVIGGGPGGYVSAIKGAQLGLSVACVEKRGVLGGTCLNVGCIPSKTLLHGSEIFEEFKSVHEWGIQVETPSIDITELQETKSDIIGTLTGGIEHLFRKNGVDYFSGFAELVDDQGEVRLVLNEGGEELIQAENIVIATGSDVIELPFLPFEEKVIMSSTGALDLDHVPRRMAVIGGGVIGLELGTVWQRFGAEVTVFEFEKEICPFMDKDLSRTLRRVLSKSGFDFKLSHLVKDCEISSCGNEATLVFENMKNGDVESQEFDAVLVSVGRVPFVDGLGLSNAGINLTQSGRIDVNECFETNVPGYFAIGDVIDGPMLAHKAEEDGVMLMEYLHEGVVPPVDYSLVPSVVYTSPEVAGVGAIQQDLEKGTYNVGKFQFMANSRARAILSKDGFVKILADKESDEILGMHIIGPCASELIMEGCLAMKAGISVKELAETCHPHPTLSEAIKEAAMATFGKCIHS